MISTEQLYNRLCNVLFLEEVRLENNVIEKQNFIVKYRPVQAEPYIELIKAQAVKEYFDRYVGSLLRWLEHFV